MSKLRGSKRRADNVNDANNDIHADNRANNDDDDDNDNGNHHEAEAAAVVKVEKVETQKNKKSNKHVEDDNNKNKKKNQVKDESGLEDEVDHDVDADDDADDDAVADDDDADADADADTDADPLEMPSNLSEQNDDNDNDEDEAEEVDEQAKKENNDSESLPSSSSSSHRGELVNLEDFLRKIQSSNAHIATSGLSGMLRLIRSSSSSSFSSSSPCSLLVDYVLSSRQCIELFSCFDSLGNFSSQYRFLSLLTQVMAAVVELGYTCTHNTVKPRSSHDITAIQAASMYVARRLLRYKLRSIVKLLCADDARMVHSALHLLLATARLAIRNQSLILEKDLLAKISMQLPVLIRLPFKPFINTNKHHANVKEKDKDDDANKSNLPLSQSALAFTTRHLYMEFVLELLQVHDVDLLKQIVQLRGFVTYMLKNLNSDPYSVVDRVLSCILTHIVSHSHLMVAYKAQFLSSYVIEQLVKCYRTSDDENDNINDNNDDDEDDEDTAAAKLTENAAHLFLEKVVAFIHSEYTQHLTAKQILPVSSSSSSSSSSSLSSLSLSMLSSWSLWKHYRGVLLRLLLTLNAHSHARQQSLGLSILSRFPVLVVDYFCQLPYSMTPRASSAWFSTMCLLINVHQLPITDNYVTYLVDTQAFASTRLLDQIFPPTLTKLCLSQGLQSSNPLVVELTLLYLSSALNRFHQFITAFERLSASSSSSSSIDDVNSVRLNRDNLRKRIPDINLIFTQRAKYQCQAPSSSSLSSSSSVDFSSLPITALDVVHLHTCIYARLIEVMTLYVTVIPEALTEAKIDAWKILDLVHDNKQQDKNTTDVSSLSPSSFPPFIQMRLVQLLSKTQLVNPRIFALKASSSSSSSSSYRARSYFGILLQMLVGLKSEASSSSSSSLLFSLSPRLSDKHQCMTVFFSSLSLANNTVSRSSAYSVVRSLLLSLLTHTGLFSAGSFDDELCAWITNIESSTVMINYAEALLCTLISTPTHYFDFTFAKKSTATGTRTYEEDSSSLSPLLLYGLAATSSTSTSFRISIPGSTSEAALHLLYSVLSDITSFGHTNRRYVIETLKSFTELASTNNGKDTVESSSSSSSSASLLRGVAHAYAALVESSPRFAALTRYVDAVLSSSSSSKSFFTQSTFDSSSSSSSPSSSSLSSSSTFLFSLLSRHSPASLNKVLPSALEACYSPFMNDSDSVTDFVSLAFNDVVTFFNTYTDISLLHLPCFNTALLASSTVTVSTKSNSGDDDEVDDSARALIAFLEYMPLPLLLSHLICDAHVSFTNSLHDLLRRRVQRLHQYASSASSSSSSSSSSLSSSLALYEREQHRSAVCAIVRLILDIIPSVLSAPASTKHARNKSRKSLSSSTSSSSSSSSSSSFLSLLFDLLHQLCNDSIEFIDIALSTKSFSSSSLLNFLHREREYLSLTSSSSSSAAVTGIIKLLLSALDLYKNKRLPLSSSVSSYIKSITEYICSDDNSADVIWYKVSLLTVFVPAVSCSPSLLQTLSESILSTSTSSSSSSSSSSTLVDLIDKSMATAIIMAEHVNSDRVVDMLTRRIMTADQKSDTVYDKLLCALLSHQRSSSSSSGDSALCFFTVNDKIDFIQYCLSHLTPLRAQIIASSIKQTTSALLTKDDKKDKNVLDVFSNSLLSSLAARPTGEILLLLPGIIALISKYSLSKSDQRQNSNNENNDNDDNDDNDEREKLTKSILETLIKRLLIDSKITLEDDEAVSADHIESSPSFKSMTVELVKAISLLPSSSSSSYALSLSDRRSLALRVLNNSTPSDQKKKKNQVKTEDDDDKDEAKDNVLLSDTQFQMLSSLLVTPFDSLSSISFLLTLSNRAFAIVLSSFLSRCLRTLSKSLKRQSKSDVDDNTNEITVKLSGMMQSLCHVFESPSFSTPLLCGILLNTAVDAKDDADDNHDEDGPSLRRGLIKSINRFLTSALRYRGVADSNVMRLVNAILVSTFRHDETRHALLAPKINENFNDNHANVTATEAPPIIAAVRNSDDDETLIDGFLSALGMYDLLVNNELFAPALLLGSTAHTQMHTEDRTTSSSSSSSKILGGRVNPALAGVCAHAKSVTRLSSASKQVLMRVLVRTLTILFSFPTLAPSVASAVSSSYEPLLLLLFACYNGTDSQCDSELTRLLSLFSSCLFGFTAKKQNGLFTYKRRWGAAGMSLLLARMKADKEKTNIGESGAKQSEEEDAMTLEPEEGLLDIKWFYTNLDAKLLVQGPTFSYENKNNNNSTPRYESRFILSFVATMLHRGTENSIINIEPRKLIEHGVLSYVVLCMSHDDLHIRKQAHLCLQLFMDALDILNTSMPIESQGEKKKASELTKEERKQMYKKAARESSSLRANYTDNSRSRAMTLGEELDFKERLQISALLIAFRTAITAKNEFIPTIISYFIGNSLFILLKPSHTLYRPLNRFILARPQLDLTDVPMLYSLLQSSHDDGANGAHHKFYRAWICKLLEKSLRTEPDYQIYARRHVTSMLMSRYHASYTDKTTRISILQMLCRGTSLVNCVSTLVTHESLLIWLRCVVQSCSSAYASTYAYSHSPSSSSSSSSTSISASINFHTPIVHVFDAVRSIALNVGTWLKSLNDADDDNSMKQDDNDADKLNDDDVDVDAPNKDKDNEKASSIRRYRVHRTRVGVLHQLRQLTNSLTSDFIINERAQDTNNTTTSNSSSSSSSAVNVSLDSALFLRHENRYAYEAVIEALSALTSVLIENSDISNSSSLRQDGNNDGVDINLSFLHALSALPLSSRLQTALIECALSSSSSSSSSSLSSSCLIWICRSALNLCVSPFPSPSSSSSSRGLRLRRNFVSFLLTSIRSNHDGRGELKTIARIMGVTEKRGDTKHH